MAEKDSKKTAVAEDESHEGHTHDHDHDHEHGHDHEHEDDDEVKFVEDPVFTVDYKGDCAYEVKVSVPPANKQKQADEMYDELRHEAEVPGFRRGKVPRRIVEKRFAKAVRSEVDAKLVSAAFRKLVKDEDLKPIRFPDIEGLEEGKERKEDEALEFTLKFEVAPKVELGKYRGVKVERPVVTVADSDVDEALEEIRSRYATFESLEKGKAAEGDQVVIDFNGLIDGEQFPGGSAEKYPYILGTKRFFPEFEKKLLGSKAGDELTCKVTLPEDTPNEDLRGKKAVFTINVRELKRRNLPELNDDFAKQVGAESVEALRERIVNQLREGSTQTSERIARSRALEAVVEASKYEIPKILIEDVARSHYEEEIRRLIQMRVPVEQIESRMEDIRKQADESAIDEIKRTVTLSEIGSAEGIEVTDADFESEATNIALQTGVDSDTVSRYISEEADRRSMYESRIFRAKAMNVIMEHAKVTDKEVPQDEIEETEKA
jgi:trigger factor